MHLLMVDKGFGSTTSAVPEAAIISAGLPIRQMPPTPPQAMAQLCEPGEGQDGGPPNAGA